jgi:molybdopterin synthase sulfur carrier subunit
MIDVKIAFLSVLEDFTKTKEITIPLDDNSTIKSIFGKLSDKFENSFEKYFVDKSGNLNKYIILALNGKDIRSLNGLDTEIHDNDEISFIPAIAGG